MKKVLLILIISLVILAVFSGFFWLYEVKFNVTKADVSSYSFSIDNSYLFVSPLRARANGQEKIRVTVFVLNNQGLGVMGKKVFLAEDNTLNIETIQGLTDAFGKAYFDVSTTKQGEYYIPVSVDNTALNQKAHLSFY